MSQRLSDLPVGSLVKDTGSLFLNKPIIWKIADKNHTGYPDGAITLITEKIIALRCFDAKEASNSNSDRQSYGNNRYSLSNIRQWLNSDAEAGKWYAAQHSADAAPNSANVWQKDSVAVNPYDTNAGFLNGFSDGFKERLLETTLTVGLNTVTDGGGSETVTDKIFLASNTEVGLANENSIVEGALLSVFSDDASRIASVTAEGLEDSNYASDPAEGAGWYWWLRTPYSSNTRSARYVNSSGALHSNYAYNGNYGVRPLCNLPSFILVSDTTDDDGCYVIETFEKIRKINFDLSTPIEAETMPERISVEVGSKIPLGASYAIFVCNNANDENPTWENCTSEVKANLVHVFTNKTKTADNWAINIKVEVDASDFDEECYISGIGGNWE